MEGVQRTDRELRHTVQQPHEAQHQHQQEQCVGSTLRVFTAHSCLLLVSRLMRALTLKQTAVLRVIKPDNELNNVPQLHTAEGKCQV